MLVPDALRVLIRTKLADGRLPHDHAPGVWGGAGRGETCNACEEVITESQFVMDRVRDNMQTVQFHVQCFYVWDIERDALSH